MTNTAFATALAALVLPATASAVDKPPAGTPANDTATQRQNCLGPFRSDLAQTVGFNGQFNPGIHYGTVAEIQFLEDNGLGNAC